MSKTKPQVKKTKKSDDVKTLFAQINVLVVGNVGQIDVAGYPLSIGLGLTNLFDGLAKDKDLKAVLDASIKIYQIKNTKK